MVCCAGEACRGDGRRVAFDFMNDPQTIASPQQPYACLWTPDAIAIDGKVDEKAWKRTSPITDFYVAGSTKRATSRTTARLLWSDTHLYFSAEMEDADVYGLHEGHDPPFGGDDVIELFVKPSRTDPFYWEFHVTPRGATRDYFYARRGAGPNERWIAYNSGMRAAVTVDGTLNRWEDRDAGWIAEVAIPWTAFERMGGRPKEGDAWTFMVARYDYSVHLEEGIELSASSILPKENFHLFEHYQDMGFIK